jgi:hypothetical protein
MILTSRTHPECYSSETVLSEVSASTDQAYKRDAGCPEGHLYKVLPAHESVMSYQVQGLDAMPCRLHAAGCVQSTCMDNEQSKAHSPRRPRDGDGTEPGHKIRHTEHRDGRVMACRGFSQYVITSSCDVARARRHRP